MHESNELKLNDLKQRKFTIEIEEIVSLLLKASQRIIDDNLYPEDVLEKVALYKDNIFDKTNLLKILCTEYCARKCVI